MYTLLTPWPPQRNGIADYARELVAEGTTSVRLISEAIRPAKIADRVVAIDERTFLNDPGRRRLYHFGNNSDHTHLVPLFLRHPGHVVLHDPSLHYLAECVDRQIPGFFDAMLTADSSVDIASLRRCWRGGLKAPMDYNELRCLAWLKSATSIIVHSEFARRSVTPLLPGVPVNVVPHFAYLRRGIGDWRSRRTDARTRLGYSSNQFLIVTFGFVTRNKQYDSIVRAISRLEIGKRNKISYVIAGEINTGQFDLMSSLGGLDTSVVELRGYVPLSVADDLMDAADLVMNLRYPTYGESSGAVARAQGAGAAIAVSDIGGFSEIPADTCFHLPARPDVSHAVAALIDRTFDDPNVVAQVRDRAWAHANGVLSPKRCSAAYEEIIYG
ncbi:glycosyltransferase [Oleomonas cavernae]|uniref:Glycosyltransferase n=1 Tax=Oleomonas cavernae TaxID=2320859 RepID=A0A418W8V5_9PROT|nr:glycosyltransferase [Oleomonas cavernae]RJF86449.1 glycosyltransferase [Oleomonas cavernae]